ncbi:S49 family peptidase [Pedobacter sp. NJ-S-72]
MASIIDARKAMKDNGINQIVVYAPQSTDKNKEYRDALDGDTTAIEDNLKFICETFISRVGNNRKGKLTSQEWNSGNMFFAEQALTIGLIDGISSFEDVVKRASILATQNQNQNSTTSLNNNQNNMGIFGSDFPVLNALKEQSAGTITAQQISAVNAELVSKGIKTW